MRTARRALAFAIAALLVAACGSDTTPTSTATTTTAQAAGSTGTGAPGQGTGTTLSPETSAPESTGFSTTPVSVPPDDASGPALLREIRAAAQENFDRVTFEFANHLPGYTVAYEDRPVIQDGSGAEVAVEGSAVLAVRMSPASGFALAAGNPTYTGPDRLSPGTPALVEVVRTGDFEGQLTWVIGVAAETGFTVSTLGSPPRLIVDVAYG